MWIEICTCMYVCKCTLYECNTRMCVCLHEILFKEQSELDLSFVVLLCLSIDYKCKKVKIPLNSNNNCNWICYAARRCWSSNRRQQMQITITTKSKTTIGTWQRHQRNLDSFLHPINIPNEFFCLLVHKSKRSIYMHM